MKERVVDDMVKKTILAFFLIMLIAALCMSQAFAEGTDGYTHFPR